MRLHAFMFAALFLVWTLISATPATAQQQAELSFQPGKLYEAAFFKIKPGKEQELDERYFSKIMPVAQKYGMRPLGTFAIDNVNHGPDDITTWGFFEWPSEAAKARFDRDKTFAKLRPIRDKLVDTLRIVSLEVQQATTITVRSDRMYEFAGLWMNRHNGAHLQKYFEAVGPWAAQQGVQFLGDFKVIGSPADYHFLPQAAFFIEWPSRAVKDAWFTSDEFARSGHHRALALDRLVVVESSFNFPQGMD